MGRAGKAVRVRLASGLSWGRDESELVTDLQAGSETAFDWLVTHYHGPVYNLIFEHAGRHIETPRTERRKFS